jgi:hypothetical protein
VLVLESGETKCKQSEKLYFENKSRVLVLVLESGETKCKQSEKLYFGKQKNTSKRSNWMKDFIS